MSAALSRDFAREVLNALGIETKGVRSFTIRFGLDEAVVVELERLVESDRVPFFVQALERYELDVIERRGHKLEGPS